MSSVTVVMNAEDAKVRAANDRMLASMKKADERYAANVQKSQEAAAAAKLALEIANRGKTAERERQKDAAAAGKIIEANLTPQEKFNAAIKASIALKDKGLLSSQQLRAEYSRLKKELASATGETAKAERAEAELNRQRQDAERIVSALRTPTEVYAASVRKLKDYEKQGLLTTQQYTSAKRNLRTELDATTKSANGSLASVKSLAVQYLSVQAAFGVLNQMAAEFDQLQQATLEKTRGIAKAQQDAVKNLAGLKFYEQEELLGTKTEGIAKETGFRGRAEIQTAIGAGISAGGSIEEVISAVTAAARLEKQSPDKLSTTASAAIDLAAASKIIDAEKNLGFLLSVGAQARVEDPAKLANALAKTVGNVAATTDSDAETGTREAAALFTVLNQFTKDKQADSSATATNQLAAYMREFFSTRDDDPGTLSGRFQSVMEDEELRQAFLDKMPGEAVFKLPMEKMVTEGSDAFKMFQEILPKIQYSAEIYRNSAEAIRTVSATAAIADIGITAESNVEAIDTTATVQARAEQKKILDETLPRVRAGGVVGMLQMVSDTTLKPINESIQQSPDSYAAYAEDVLSGRRTQLDSRPDLQSFIDQQIALIDALAVKAAIEEYRERMGVRSAAEIQREAAEKNLAAANRMSQSTHTAAARQTAAIAGASQGGG